ncbi:hypothetical protein TRV_00874 [Trichophyton verrucosum HKI 0517]|uniref:Uncharacterized protein n=1 Tax=Trichophyton verrucosum (strain HKI 0517) TaxID=663202 RepID=D4D1C4_TRIVH|nr:uncharacterized protein TRV_00874 [Trichophyton verrucosum HKI 0517]EFE44342.1 hypothetical protein TRV_00874 [Trichophyton verrucosum HKI 0517]
MAKRVSFRQRKHTLDLPLPFSFVLSSSKSHYNKDNNSSSTNSISISSNSTRTMPCNCTAPGADPSAAWPALISLSFEGIAQLGAGGIMGIIATMGLFFGLCATNLSGAIGYAIRRWADSRRPDLPPPTTTATTTTDNPPPPLTLPVEEPAPADPAIADSPPPPPSSTEEAPPASGPTDEESCSSVDISKLEPMDTALQAFEEADAPAPEEELLPSSKLVVSKSKLYKSQKYVRLLFFFSPVFCIFYCFLFFYLFFLFFLFKEQINNFLSREI